MKTLEELKAIKDSVQGSIGVRSADSKETRVVVGMATCGIASGARPVLETISAAVKNAKMDNVIVKQTGCIGLCQHEPIMEVFEPGKGKVTYIKMDAEKAAKVFEQHIVRGEVVEEYLLHEDGKAVTSIEDSVFCRHQQRIALRNCGLINPEEIEEYIGTGGYTALHKVLTEMTPDEVIQEVLDSGIRGRGVQVSQLV